MEKQPSPDCESMTTVTVKDYTPGMEYPDPPPSYRGVSKQHPMVQVAKIVALTAILIAAMLSTAIVVSAWLTSNSACQFQAGGIETILEPQSLRSALLVGTSDLDSSESKIDSGSSSTNKPLMNSKDSTNNNKKEASTAEDNDSGSNGEEDDDDDDDDSVTMLKLPLELNLQEHMFEKLNHRSNMNCVIEKKKAEEIVDEQSKPLPSFLGVNMTTDPRYLHFTGEKMIVSCGSDEPNQPRNGFLPPPPPPQYHQQQQPSAASAQMPMIHSQPQEQALHPLLMEMLNGPAPAPMLFPPPHHPMFGPPQPNHLNNPFQSSPFQRNGPFSSPSSGSPFNPNNNNNKKNIHMIGPIPIRPDQNPLEILLQHVIADSQSDPLINGASHNTITRNSINNNGESSSPHLLPIFIPNNNNDLSDEISSGPIFFSGAQQHQTPPQSPPQGRSIQFQLPGSFLSQVDRRNQPSEQDSAEQQIPTGQIISELLQESLNLGERALPHPIPIQPRLQHVIRPRSTDNVEVEKKHRVKRCACDCACKNHNPLKE